MITLIDISMLNLYEREMKGWDFSLDYTFDAGKAGTFTFSGVHSLVDSTTTQYSLDTPSYQGVNYPLDTTIGGALRHQTNLTLSWLHGPLSIGWTSRIVSSYNAYGSAGGPLSVRYGGGANYSTYADAQGGDGTIPAQDIHDVVMSYRFNDTSGRGILAGITSGMTVSMGIRNVFDTPPAFDAGPFALGFFSPFVDVRMREGWITLTRAF